MEWEKAEYERISGKIKKRTKKGTSNPLKKGNKLDLKETMLERRAEERLPLERKAITNGFPNTKTKKSIKGIKTVNFENKARKKKKPAKP